jgi:hypothetical protein
MSAVSASQVMVVSQIYNLTLGMRSIQALKRSNPVGERWNSSTRLPLVFFGLCFPNLMLAPGSTSLY